MQKTDCLKLVNWIKKTKKKARWKCGLDTFGSGKGQVLVFVHMTVDSQVQCDITNFFMRWSSDSAVCRYAQQSVMFNFLTPNVNYSGRTAPLTPKVAFYIFIQQIQVLNILNMVCIVSIFFSSKCSLFHNSNVFGSCIIHILYTGCAKIKKIIPAPKG